MPNTSTGPLFLDYDNDGHKDLFVSSTGEQILFENRLVPDGRMMFWDSSASAGVVGRAIGFSAAAGDVNKDGYPDIYVASYNRYGEILPDDWNGATNGTPKLLFLSQGDGTHKEAGAVWAWLIVAEVTQPNLRTSMRIVTSTCMWPTTSAVAMRSI